ncbi:MAG: hypothetical protein IJU74_09185 [Bacteroidales bacterium]|nr:hypothetical protein [Bacteroidales bacterium]
MKKIFALVAVMALSVSFLSAQNAYRSAGDMTLGGDAGYGQVGIGAAVSFEYTIFGWGSYGSLSAGGYLGDSFMKSVNHLLVGPMACYRFPIGERFDLSAKTIVGLRSMSSGHTRLNSLGSRLHRGDLLSLGQDGDWYRTGSWWSDHPVRSSFFQVI